MAAFGVVNVRHNPGHSGPAPPGVNVLKAVQCSSCDALLPYQAVMHPARNDRWDSDREEGFLQPCGDLKFP